MPYVAIVDDEEAVRKALKRLLRAAGLEAETYASGREFLQASALRPPDCLVLDLHMPGMSGLQVLRELRAAPGAPPTGASAYLRKPLDERLLLNAISATVKRIPRENES